MQTARSSYESPSIRTQVGNKTRRNNPDINLGSMSPEEIRRLLHELQVHQIELKTQNKELKRIYDELEVSKQKYFELYDLAPIGYFSIDKEGLITEANLTGANLLDIERNELINKSIEHFIIKDDQDIYYLHRKKLFESCKQQACELRMKHRDGSLFWVRLEGNISHDVQSEEPSFRVVVSNITEYKLLEQDQLKTQRQILKLQKYESLGVMAGGIAHDFNNILTAIIGSIELTLLDLCLPETAKKFLNIALESSKHAADLTAQILAYSGHGILQVMDVDISNLIEDFNTMFCASVSKKVTISYNLDKDLPVIKADRTQIIQIIMNLAINASEAIGGETGDIRISTGTMKCSAEYLESTWMNQHPPEGQYVYIEVEDNGCGINKEDLDKIFDPFFTTNFIGRGLGLAAVLGLVKGHNGTIKIESNPGKGSKFRVLLPAQDYSTTVLKPQAPVTTSYTKTKILLVDDEKVVLDVATSMLKHLGYNIQTASNGEEAIKLFKDNISSSTRHKDRIGCVILDLSMPLMNGAKTLPAFIEMDQDIPVIIASGYSEDIMKKRFDKKGAKGFLQKPYQLSTLNEKIQKALSWVKN